MAHGCIQVKPSILAAWDPGWQPESWGGKQLPKEGLAREPQLLPPELGRVRRGEGNFLQDTSVS